MNIPPHPCNIVLNIYQGLGLAWYTNATSSYVKHTTGPRPALYKSQSPPINDFNFRSLCENTEAYCVFAHIRASSGSAVTQVNSHPFVFGRHIFMHNGVISNFSAIRREMTDLLSFDAYCNILGSTDSEHSAALYMTNLTNHGTKSSWQETYPLSDMLAAMQKTIVQILELQRIKSGDARTPKRDQLDAVEIGQNEESEICDSVHSEDPSTGDNNSAPQAPSFPVLSPWTQANSNSQRQRNPQSRTMQHHLRP